MLIARTGRLALALFLLALVGLRYAEPVNDGDLFWQMAYGRWLLEHRTLVPDHAVFSWTPASREIIYCAWLSQTGLYLLHQAGGLPALFALKYCLWLLALVLAWQAARSAGVLPRPELPVAAVTVILACYAGTNLKPEMFSFAAMHLLAWGAWRFKNEALQGKNIRRWLFFFPLLMLLWVNSHGAFIFGSLFLILFLTGECLQRRLKGRGALPQGALRGLAWSVTASLAAVLCTPYHIRYPLQLIADRLLSQANRPAMVTVDAWASIFHPLQRPLHFPEYLAVMAALLVLAGIRRWRAGGGVDTGVLLPNLAFAALYSAWVRTTYLWPPVFFHSLVYMLVTTPERKPGERPGKAAAWIMLAVTLFLGSRGMFEALARPYKALWPGFGVSYLSPVDEAEFLARFHPGTRLGNDYDSGGYLMWRLYPTYRVMIDPRAFPYRSWYGEYVDFILGREVEGFLERHPFDVAVIPLAFRRCLYHFLTSDRWTLVYYGPVAAIFVGPGVEIPAGASRFHADRFEQPIRNLQYALNAFVFAYESGDRDNAWRILAAMDRYYRWPGQREIVDALLLFRRAVWAFDAGQYERALELMEQARSRKVYIDVRMLASLYRWKYDQLTAAGRETEALRYRQAFDELMDEVAGN